jgi:hypothetical protein
MLKVKSISEAEVRLLESSLDLTPITFSPEGR